MERVGRITAETGRVCESFGEPDHLEIATRPAMGEHDRKGIVADTYEVDRMQAPPVDVGGHLVAVDVEGDRGTERLADASRIARASSGPDRTGSLPWSRRTSHQRREEGRRQDA